MDPGSIPSSRLQAALASDLLFFAVASVIMAGGLSSLLLARLKFRDRLLLYLGLFAVLYASLLFLRNRLIYQALSVSSRQIPWWFYCLNFLVPIPYALTARELLGPGWRKSISLWLWIQSAFALFAISFTVFERRPQRIYVVYLSLVIGGTVLVLLHAIFRHKSAEAIAKGLRWPLIVFCASVLISPTVEPLGFLVLIVGLGVAAFQHVSARERKLVQVEQELATAWRIQSSIIPRMAPELIGVRIAMRYKPMTSVAGDFYDFLQTSENSVTILIADVSGHGIPAALVASMLKICFAAQRDRANDPAGILASINAMLASSLGDQYVTAGCAAVNLAVHTVTYAGAGHPPALLLKKEKGEVTELAENGLLLGPFPNATYTNVAAPFEAGDELLLYTDGIVEATGHDGQEFGLENLERLMRDSSDLEPGEFIDLLFRKIATPQQQDDLTAVAVQLLPHSTGSEAKQIANAQTGLTEKS